MATWILAMLVMLVILPIAARAEDYPAKSITFIVPFAAGGSSDVIARLVAEKLGDHLGRPLVIENIGGAGGAIGLARLASATPDGYTIGLGNAGTNAAAYTINPNLKYTPDSFAEVGLVAKTFAILALKKSHAASTLADFVAYAKANPGAATLGHAGVGSSNYLSCKIFMQAAGVEVTLVSYRGAAPALNDLLAGQIDGVCDNAASVSASIEGGLAKGLAIAGPVRLPNLPNVPSAPEAGLPGFQSQGWNVIYAPKGTPEPIIARLNAALRKAVADEKLQGRLNELGAIAAHADELEPAFARNLMLADTARFKALLAGAKAN
jgi:tripartite-type tricarboxylate transporter receptor subunit TctC